MERLRNIKHRLSMSVDKLGPSRRSKSQQRKSAPLGSAPFSDGDIPGSVRNAEATSLAKSSSRPSSYCGPDTGSAECLVEVVPAAAAAATSEDTGENPGASSMPQTQPEVTAPTEPSSEPAAAAQPESKGERQLKRATSSEGGESLMAEVMKEVEKITEITEDLKKKRIRRDESAADDTAVAVNDTVPLLSAPEAAAQETLAASTSGAILRQKTLTEGVVHRKNLESTSTTLSIASTCRAESLTSGYFSDSELTLSEGRCDSEARSVFSSAVSEISESSKSVITEKIDRRRSAFVSVSSSNTENRKSAFIPVSPDSSEKRLSAFIPLMPEINSEIKPGPSAGATEKAAAETSGKESTKEAPAAEPSVAVTATAAKQETKVTKKESIYSKIVKRKDTSKEPIYAKIKPKLTIETSFQPIEPSSSKSPTTPSSAVVKPEPMYNVVKPLDPLAPVTPRSPTSSAIPGSPLGPFTVFGGGPPSSSKKVEPIYTKIQPKESRSNTLPKEPIYSKIQRKESGTLPRDASDSKIKAKEPIYTQPLPLTPREEAMQKRESFFSESVSPDYGKVTVRAKEIASSRPAVITISNPGYAAPTTSANPSTPATSSSSPAAPTSPTSPISMLSCIPALTEETAASQTSKVKMVEKVECTPASASSLDSPGPRHHVASESSLVESSDTESTGRAKLSKLVEELAQELEAVSQRVGISADTDDESKKEMLAKLLSAYDIPKNLRRVEEADEDAVRQAEEALVPTSVSMDELRFVDDNEDNAETVYADIPDYSQDEFVIALDDENDPRYASLARKFRQQARSSESPGKISRKTATVYANALNVVTALRVLINSKSARAASVINKMGTLARPYAHKVQGTITDTTWIQRVIYHKTGHNGFDELRRYIKSGGEFCKELAAIMNERAELEANYAKGLHKLSAKLLKASKESMGTVNQAWQMVGAELEQEGDLHKSIASAITDDVVRPLRQLIETQHKIRKGVESMVDKTTKNLHDWRAAESKSKKQCYGNCRENEKIQDMMIEARLGRGKTLSEKEALKVEKQRRKAEEAVQKSDLEYYTCCIRTERARLEWESAIYKGSNCFQTLEEERLQALKDLVVKYHKNAKEAAPKLVAIASRLDDPVAACDVEKDIQTVISAKGTGENIPEQMLPDFYAEDMNNIMNRERRKEALEKFVQMLKTDLERERRGKQGVENLAKALQETPTFGGEESQQDVNDKLQHDAYNRLQHMKAMLAYLEAARYKVQCSLDELNNRPRMTHPLAKHIEVHRDKQGLNFSVLKVPPWVRGNSVDVSPASDSPTGSPNWNDRGTADGTSVQPDSDFEPIVEKPVPPRIDSLIPTPPVRTKASATATTTEPNTENENKAPSGTAPKPSKVPHVFMSPPRYPSLMIIADEFSSQGSDRDYQTAVTEDNLDSGIKDGTYYARPLESVPTVGRCKALYDYEANMYDELTIRTGDIINIHDKQPDGWWVGELDSVVGIFPATYVEEID
ncbi:uncharacterized protein LOC125045783 isoform X1 [Penaeus chinensis]|uniref:uncharacterized protein LOC125045783 isoform X1 n=1 Tax=Penaeus chinensis TaxID=139456 RepID=UPI001FB7AB15|nr:uncharacterized protein LOC125045783 isoform X1 [Penaeus chinensis]